jgi:hypothetical protein
MLRAWTGIKINDSKGTDLNARQFGLIISEGPGGCRYNTLDREDNMIMLDTSIDLEFDAMDLYFDKNQLASTCDPDQWASKLKSLTWKGQPR